jgi:lipoate-protein ligase A
VVVGKHQNLLAEVDYRFCIENGITLARRISGGGTVFHDRGNVNFSFIKNVAGPHEISFQRFVEPVRQALKALDVEAVISGRNDLLVGGLKISGNAEHVFKNRVLHHGTLLFNSDLENLGEAIKVVPGKYQSKAVQSNRSPVGNISSFLKKEMKMSEFVDFLFEFHAGNANSRAYNLSEEDQRQIRILAESKFKTFDWLYGYSPAYLFKNSQIINGNRMDVELRVKQGIIIECCVDGDFFTKDISMRFDRVFHDKKHQFDEIKILLEEIVPGISEEVVYTFF